MAISQEIINEDSENGIEDNIDISMTKDSHDIEQLCSLVHTLIEKKVTVFLCRNLAPKMLLKCLLLTWKSLGTSKVLSDSILDIS